MKLRNEFPRKVKLLYLGHWRCFVCGGNGTGRGGLEIHHILGRCSASAFNSSCLCGECHVHIGHDTGTHQRLFAETARHLRERKYSPSVVDWQFLEENFSELVGPDVIKWLKT